MKKLLLPLIVIVIIAVALLRSMQGREIPYQHLEGTVFGTIYHITYQGDEDYHDEIRSALRDFDASLSMFNAESIISRFNRNDSTAVADHYFTTVFRCAEQVSAATHGAFDITVAPLVNLWGFGFQHSDSVTAEAVDSIRTFVGYQLVSLTDSGHIVKADPRVIMDASSVAKGYASDVIAELLRQHGISNYMVEIGGEIALNGVNAKGEAWSIGINKPTEDASNTNQEIENVLRLTSGGMATSGNYRNFYYHEGRRVAHTIDPHTGYPIQQDILSSTVLAADCMTADAYATAFMVLGKERSLEILAQDTTLCAYFIVSAADSTAEHPYDIVYSPRLEDKLKLKSR
jgi:thiamine biosynthesis lipoprotein